MKLISFLKSKTFIANLILACLLIALLLWGITSVLDSYTRHGENIRVPDLHRLSYEEAVEKLEKHELSPEILDSAEFDPGYPKGSIIAQYPLPGASVKEGRAVKLTINPLKPRKIEIPELLEKTKRRAVYDLLSKGFKLGELEYVPYIGKDVVVDVKVEGRSVRANDKFDKGTVVVLVLGQGIGTSMIQVPYLKNMTLAEAEERLLNLSLNKGAITYDEDVTDTAAAFIYNQYPAPSRTPSIHIGQQIDLWLTNDYTKRAVDSLNYSEIPDSAQYAETPSAL